MFFLRSFSSVIALSTACVALPTASNGIDFKSSVVEKLSNPPAGWVRDDSAKVDKDAASITLKIHLVNQGMDKFHDLAMNVSLGFKNLRPIFSPANIRTTDRNSRA